MKLFRYICFMSTDVSEIFKGKKKSIYIASF